MTCQGFIEVRLAQLTRGRASGSVGDMSLQQRKELMEVGSKLRFVRKQVAHASVQGELPAPA